MTNSTNGQQTVQELIAEVQLWTTNPLVAQALEAVKQGGERKVYVEFDDVKIYSIIKSS